MGGFCLYVPAERAENGTACGCNKRDELANRDGNLRAVVRLNKPRDRDEIGLQSILLQNSLVSSPSARGGSEMHRFFSARQDRRDVNGWSDDSQSDQWRAQARAHLERSRLIATRHHISR